MKDFWIILRAAWVSFFVTFLWRMLPQKSRIENLKYIKNEFTNFLWVFENSNRDVPNLKLNTSTIWTKTLWKKHQPMTEITARKCSKNNQNWTRISKNHIYPSDLTFQKGQKMYKHGEKLCYDRKKYFSRPSFDRPVGLKSVFDQNKFFRPKKKKQFGSGGMWFFQLTTEFQLFEHTVAFRFLTDLSEITSFI